MKKTSFLFVAAGLLLSVPAPARAQDQPLPKPPNVLRIGREEVKPGKSAAHTKLETAWTRAFAAAKWPFHFLAMSAVSGANEVWFVTGYDSLEAAEKDEQSLQKNPALRAEVERFAAQESEFLSGTRGVTAIYREEMSYRGSSTPLGKARYFYITTVRVRPGHESEYAEVNKIVREAHAKAGVPERWSVFEVTLGMSRGTYLVSQPLKSLADVDAFAETHGKAYREAMGDEGRKKLAELTGASVLSAETNVYAFSPEMSYAPPEVAAADPEFWNPKPAKAATGAKKSAEKPAAKP